MQKRTLGKTGMELSIIGQGGFHLVELENRDAERILAAYLDRGGNYIETAVSYGDGRSERKIGRAVSHRRDEYFLATKCEKRSKADAARQIETSLKNLRTDHLDIIFIHGVQTMPELDTALSPDGSVAAAEEAKKAGKVRFIGITGHGQQDTLREAVKRYPFQVLMTGFNYFDRFNFPDTEEKLLHECLEKGIGVLAMKALADGYLYRSWEQGIRYSLSLPVASLVLGMNTMEQLERDMTLAENFTPMTAGEREELFRSAPELGDYVCRRCGECRTAEFDPMEIFLLEGLYDRQMDDRRMGDTADYALRERLKHWFGQRDRAREAYAAYPKKVNPEADYSRLSALCPHGIDVDRKLKIAHDKLGASGYMY